jgi:hypothetical protein
MSCVTGKNDQSIGFFVFDNGAVAGFDPHGTVFDATLQRDASRVTAQRVGVRRRDVPA